MPSFYEEIYKGYRICISDEVISSDSRVPAVITDSDCGLYGAGIGNDRLSAVKAAKAKIDNLPALKAKLAYK